MKSDEVLTDSDKRLIRALNGGSLDGGSVGVAELKIDIASSRLDGTLTGDVTPSYINQQLQNNATTAALDAQQAGAYARQGNNLLAQAYNAYAANPGVPDSVLQRALTYLNTGTV
jgi:hypothetical protein